MARPALEPTDVVPRRPWPFARTAAIVHSIVTLALFAPLLVSTDRLACSILGDLPAYLLPLRVYGFESLAAGRFPAWNPYVFAGTPYAANFQTALFYPPNWLYLVLPAVIATNVLVALHFFLIAFVTSLWAHWRTRQAGPALLAGVTFACSGGIFLHVYAGHLLILSAAPWLVAWFWSLDAILADPSRATQRALPCGAAAIAIALLAGHPQPVYYAAVAGILYVAIRLPRTDRKARAAACSLATLAAGVLFAAVQIIPAAMLTTISSRAVGVSPEVAVQYSLPPENLLTSILPEFLGPPGAGYVGRWSLWEVSIYLGVVPVFFAAYAGATRRDSRPLALLVVVAILLAGVSAPVFHTLRAVLPGYASFRAPGRAGLFVDLFIAILAADGLATVARSRPTRRTALAACGLSAALALTAAVVNYYPDLWSRSLRAIVATGQAFHPLPDLDKVAESLGQLTAGLATAATLAAAIAAALLIWRRYPARAGRLAVAIIACLAAADSLRTAWNWRDISPARLPYPPQWSAAVADVAERPDARVLTGVTAWANVALNDGFLDAGGYDSVILARYAAFLAISQGEDPRTANFATDVTHPSALLRALRVHYLLHLSPDGRNPVVTPIPAPMARLHFAYQYVTRPDLDGVYAALADPAFDPATTVILESPPVPAPAAPAGEPIARVVASSPESVEIEATTPTPAILLMTDAYAPGWRVTSLSNSPQSHYDLLPADLALRAIPLSAGTHHLLIRYTAPGLAAGTWISALSILSAITLLLVSRRPPRSQA